MELTNLVLLFTVAFGLGMLHALDADHVMAVSSLIAKRGQRGKNISFCLRWAAGHGAVLVLIGVMVFLLGMSFPAKLSIYAEMLVGLILITIGVLVLARIHNLGIHFHFHKHDGMPAHAHWHARDNDHHEGRKEHAHKHAAVIIGVMHGLAGSAPLLALIPVSTMDSPFYGFVYMIIFSTGVFVAMLLFGGMLGIIFDRTWRSGTRAVKLLHLLTGAGAVISGLFIMRSAML